MLTCLGHKPTLNILNMQSGIIASKHRVGSEEFQARFAELFEASDHDGGYLDGNAIDLTRTYWSFLLY
ncbi:hypothetical protein BDZ91DRAFT_743376 [Kalaharituber pfeilii]|nr:hypothetical protein BDZ91DRAFT_743376 [Kalaharituber pfeilii]